MRSRSLALSSTSIASFVCLVGMTSLPFCGVEPRPPNVHKLTGGVHQRAHPLEIKLARSPPGPEAKVEITAYRAVPGETIIAVLSVHLCTQKSGMITYCRYCGGKGTSGWQRDAETLGTTSDGRSTTCCGGSAPATLL